MNWRKATPDDAPLLGRMNAHLILDEGHRNPITVPELERRVAAWLAGEYEAVLFDDAGAVVAYALFRNDPDSIYLRQFFVERERRSQGIGRAAIGTLMRDVWPQGARITLEVLSGNTAGQRFWRAVGFRDYAITLERLTPGAATE